MNEENIPQSTGLSSQQKTGFVLLLVFAILTVGLGFLQLRNNIYGPFVVRPSVKAANTFVDEITRLQQIDTDKDGLNDYEEIEFFNTSPYIPDTDSDGISDKDELDIGSDPLCASGQDCDTAESVPELEQNSFGLVEPSLDGTGTFQEALTGNVTAGSILQSQNGGFDPSQVEELLKNPEQLRQLLRQTGQISATELDKFDDASLIEIAKTIFTTEAVSEPNPAVPSGETN